MIETRILVRNGKLRKRDRIVFDVVVVASAAVLRIVRIVKGG